MVFMGGNHDARAAIGGRAGAAAVTAGLLAAGTVPAQAAMHGMELQAALHSSHAYPRAAGYAHMDHHSGVPACRSGQPVRVRTRSGTLVASGTFHTHHN
jgi:hypothetical protein